MAVDLARLRNQTLADGQDSEVTVNTRALIDKVLARYSSEHTTLRELIQNASDAGATTVTVRFETDPSLTIPTPQGAEKSSLIKHTIQNHTLKRLVVSNNGQPFTTADWNRLKSIAEGNPDETKIGAFGVGFYSVFADCDEPFVISGQKTMAFYWKGDNKTTLSTRISTLPSEHSSSDTTFSLDYRQANPASPSYNPSKIPNLPTLCQFLATSLTFVGLQGIELYLDDYRVASLVKKISPPSEIQVPAGLKTETEGGLMRVTNITRQHSQIDAEWSNVIATAQLPPKRAADVVQAEVRNAGTALKSFFSKFSTPATPPPKLNKPTPSQENGIGNRDGISGESRGTIFLQVCTVEVATRVSRSFSAEIERATKKPPPKSTKIALLTSPYHDPSASLTSGTGNTADLGSKIFAEVLPTKSGRIFIGFPTQQTTPFLAHVSAPSLIPTVERENVDMNARYISTWNKELLRVAGLACRVSYSLDISDLRERYSKEPLEALIPQATYICKQYTANVSHPSTVLGETVEEAFFNCSKERSIAILSTQGVKGSKFVRMPAEKLSFLGEVAMVPQELATEAIPFLVSLHNRGFISELTMTDIRNGLESRALSEEELIEFLKWCGAKLEGQELDSNGVRNLFDVTVANIGVNPKENSGKILALGDISSYVNASRINPELPIPLDTMPFTFSKGIPVKQLQMFGWSELSTIRWLRFMTAPPQLQELTTSEKLASQVLGLISKGWDMLNNESKETAINVLRQHAVMPTKMGMRRPEESYFPNVKLFDDLPTVKPFPGAKDKFILALGVRKTVDLPTVFERLTQAGSKKGTSSQGDLIKYFASVMDDMPKKDLERLCQTPFLSGEGGTVKENQIFRAQDLYAPDQAILSLGLVQIKLPFEFSPNSREGTLLFRLALKRYPDSVTLMNIMHRAGQVNDRQLWTLALEYYLQNFFKNNYGTGVRQVAATTHGILPTEQAPFPTLVAPFQCFTNEKAAALGYAILRSDLKPHADKFGIQQDPDIKDCVQRLIKNPPQKKLEAEEQFAYIAGRASELDQQRALISDIAVAKIVPVFRKYYIDPNCAGFEDRTRKQTGKFEYRMHHYDAPETVFVGRDQDYKGILDYVQYSPEATAFLLKVGAKHEPSSHDLASLLCKNPSRFLNTIGQDRYLDLLRKLADHASALWKDKELVKLLIGSRVLLGYHDIKDNTKKQLPIEEDDLDADLDADVHREWSLNRANEIVIIDDINAMTMFRDYIIAAPQEEQLEEFYAKFGVKKISELVKADRRIGVQVRDQSSAQKLRKDILERARLFLHEYERDGSTKSIRHDAKWLAANLSVQSVSDISIRYSLSERNVATSTTRTAAIVRVRGGIILHITPKYDIYEVSAELVKVLIQRPKQNDAIALERILTESLRRLQAKGINVERILRRKEYEARIAKQQELEREQEEQQRLAEQAKHAPPQPNEDGARSLPPSSETPEKAHSMPGAFGSPDKADDKHDMDLAYPNPPPSSQNNPISNWAKKLGFKQPGSFAPRPNDTSGPQISKDLQATRANIQNAIKECRPTNMDRINNKHHQDPTELDKGGYCNGEQWENLHKAFSVPYSGRHVDIYFGKSQAETAQELSVPLSHFLPLVFGLTSIFGVNPAAVNIFLDNKSNTVAFNMSGSLFFNLAWFMGLHEAGYGTAEGRLRALDSWFFTYAHELAHNLVSDHNARHNWYQQQISIEYSQQYRAALGGFLQGVGTASLMD